MTEGDSLQTAHVNGKLLDESSDWNGLLHDVKSVKVVGWRRDHASASESA